MDTIVIHKKGRRQVSRKKTYPEKRERRGIPKKDVSRKKEYNRYPEKILISIFLSFLARKSFFEGTRDFFILLSFYPFILLSLYLFAKCRYPLHFVSLIFFIFSGVVTKKKEKGCAYPFAVYLCEGIRACPFARIRYVFFRSKGYYLFEEKKCPFEGILTRIRAANGIRVLEQRKDTYPFAGYFCSNSKGSKKVFFWDRRDM